MKTVTLIFRDAKRQEAGLVGLNGLIPAGSTFFDNDSKTGHEPKKRRILSKRKLMKRIAAFPSDRESRVLHSDPRGLESSIETFNGAG